jgi:hypothetical protein
MTGQTDQAQVWGPDNAADPLSATLLDASCLKPGLRIGYVLDVRWLFTLRLQDLMRSQGAPVRTPPRNVFARLRRSDAVVFDADIAAYATGVRAEPVKTIDTEFAMRYGLDDYSWTALNYAHAQRVRYSNQIIEPGWFIQPMPMLLGSFCVVLTCKPTGMIPPLPGAARCVARVEWPLGKTQTVWAWVGVWIDGCALPAAFAQRIRALPSMQCGEFERRGGWVKYLGDKVRQHFGERGDDEAALRKKLGFKPGKLISEEILYRSICEIFGAAAVKRHYRGPELQGLELDVWVPALQLGFEYQGEQHLKHVKHWHGADGFTRQQERDARKKRLCAELGYRVFYFYPDDWLDKTEVIQRLRSADVLQPGYE